MHLLTGIPIGCSRTNSVATQVDMVPDDINEDEECMHDFDEVPVPNLYDTDYSPLDEPSGQYVISPFLVIISFTVGVNDKFV